MDMSMTIVKRKIWDLVMMFIITNGFGGAILLLQDMRARGWSAVKRGKPALATEGCAA